MIVAMTGHRPEKMKKYSREEITDSIMSDFMHLDADYVIQGMASGIDLWSAHAAYQLGIPYECAVPWQGHKPRKDDIAQYDLALKHATQVTYTNLSDNYLGPWLYQRRNEYMVDNADNVLAYWDGTSGGTMNCIIYAIRKKKPLWRANPNDLAAPLEWLT